MRDEGAGVCTRKTMPGLRAAQKYAVRSAADRNRFGLDDAVLIKDNHVAIAGGVRPAVERTRAGVGHLVKIELEVDTLAQLQEAMKLGVDAVLLDNMGPDMLRQAVEIVGGRAITEASGRIRSDTAPAIAASGSICCRSAGSRTARRCWTSGWIIAGRRRNPGRRAHCFVAALLAMTV